MIGRGGMGAVYRARHLALDKPVAVKILAPHLSGDREYIARFVLEARAAARLDHPNVVHVLNVAQENGRYFITMAFVEGESAEQVLRREGRIEVGRATRLLRDVASGLAALHREGIIHRDIKPANILIARDGGVKITDFGLARAVERSTGFTSDGSFMGTPEYVSPEQAEGGEIDPRSDLYSLGVTYYQLLTGQLPFQGKSAVDVAAKHLRDEPPAILEVMPILDARAAAVVHRLLQKDRERRYASAEELVADLNRFLEGGEVEAPEPPEPVRDEALASAPTVPTPRPPPPPPRVAPPPSTARARRVDRGLRRGVFWALLGASWVLFFVVGAKGGPHRGSEGWTALLGHFAASDEGAIARVALAALAVLSFVAAFLANRAALSGASSPFLGALLMLGAGVCLYVGGLHAAGPAAAASPVGQALARALESRSHPCHVGLLAVWGAATGLLLAMSRETTGPARGVGVGLVLLSLSFAAAFGAGGALGSLARRLGEDAGLVLVALAAAASALLGLRLACTRRREFGRLAGVFLVFVGLAGAFLLGGLGDRSESHALRLLRFPAALFEFQGILTLGLLLGVWGKWLLRRRLDPAPAL